MNLKKDTITVYWCPDESAFRQNQQVLLDLKPKSLFSELIKNRNLKIHKNKDFFGGGYQMCPAFEELSHNMYVVKSPFSAKMKLNDDGTIVRPTTDPIPYHQWFQERNPSFNNSFALDFSISYMFFCEEPLEVSLTPPYMHKTTTSNYGFLSSVKWDISSWFRPFIFIYHLWENINEFEVVDNEVLGYLKFHTNKKIEFKEFNMTESLQNQALSCSQHKFIQPWKTMRQLYEVFHKTSMNSRVLKEIKKNLVS
jgi:hypothetical protein